RCSDRDQLTDDGDDGNDYGYGGDGRNDGHDGHDGHGGDSRADGSGARDGENNDSSVNGSNGAGTAVGAGGGHRGAALDGDYRMDLDEERRARWRWLHAHPVTATVLDCDDGLRKPVPPVEELRGLAHGTVPVLCRFDSHRRGDDAAAFASLVRGGFGVALWRRRRGLPDAVCGEFHRGTLDEIGGPANAHRLPEAVRDLRARLRSGRPETFWADGIALMYDNPHQPLPGTGDPVEAP
ncbi:VMAP-C domain-containing protein, partial [Streptomyces olivaceus]